MNNLRCFLFFLLIGLIASCTTNKEPEQIAENEPAKDTAPKIIPTTFPMNKDTMAKAIREQEALLKSFKTANKFDEAKANAMISQYIDFANNFPEDKENTPDFIYNAAQLAATLKQGKQSIEFLNRFISAYPKHPKTSACKFLIGFVYENVLKNKEKARQSYTIFLNEHPKHKLAASAKGLLDNLNLSDEELLKKLNKVKS